MPPVWWKRSRLEGASIRGKKGKFRAMDTILVDKVARKIFYDQWSPELLRLFTEDMGDGYNRLKGSELSLMFDGDWAHCMSCKSVHRPVSGLMHCLDCGSQGTNHLDPDSSPVFLARKGFYRKPVMESLVESPRQPMALIAAEHTAQLNAPQNEDVFSKAEENELLFQDIELGSKGNRKTAIDVLSSTTTMEVGIDIGALSAVALRNMPPSRANYQQRSGRAGRRGNAVATVIAFGSSDSHDEHYFSKPDSMIRGEVVDPKLTLDNKEIVRRHIRAFLLQNYHQDRLPKIEPGQRHDLFSVLGTVSEFRSGESILNHDDFRYWLTEHEQHLQGRIRSWIPEELSEDDRKSLLKDMKNDCLKVVGDAIQPGPGETTVEEEAENEDAPEQGEEMDRNETRDCEACGGEETFGPGRYWLRPPGFAHPIDIEEVTSPEDIPETSYATRAKLTMSTVEEARWIPVNDRIRVLKVRERLLVSNTGPNRNGYTYCTKCGRIESSTDHDSKLIGAHKKPYPGNDEQMCESVTPTRHVVLGTDFITDIVLFSMRVAAPLNLKPGHSSTFVALRTISEALAKAACQLVACWKLLGYQNINQKKYRLSFEKIVRMFCLTLVFDILPESNNGSRYLKHGI